MHAHNFLTIYFLIFAILFALTHARDYKSQPKGLSKALRNYEKRYDYASQQRNHIKSAESANETMLRGADELADLTFQFSGASLDWPCEATKNIYLQTNRYVQRNVIATRAQMLAHGLFVALPRYKQGVPFTLGKVVLRRGKCTTKIAPYPCWSAQEEANCEALQSVVDIFLDRNNVLWALDVGTVNTLEKPIRRCAPKIVAINTENNRIVRHIDLSDLAAEESQLQFLVVDYGHDQRPFVYVADGGTRTILVYDVLAKSGSRIVLPPSIATNDDGDVLYMALTTKPNGSSSLYFTYLCSPNLYAINSEYLRTGVGVGSVVDVGAKPYGKKMILLGSDGGTSLFFRYNGDNDIYMWQTDSCFKDTNLREVQRGGSCRLTTQVLPGHRRFMWALESNFPDFMAGNTGCNGPSILLHPLAEFQ